MLMESELSSDYSDDGSLPPPSGAHAVLSGDSELAAACCRADPHGLAAAVSSWLMSFGAAKPFSTGSSEELRAALR
jgi:hypothetical protein